MKHEFTDPVSGQICWLETDPLGVYHPDCGELADVVVALDCFYCPACGFNGRLSGAWVLELLQAGGR